MLADLKESFKGDVPVLIDAEGNCWVRQVTAKKHLDCTSDLKTVFNSKSFKCLKDLVGVESGIEVLYSGQRQYAISYTDFKLLCVWGYVYKGLSKFKPLEQPFKDYADKYEQYLGLSVSGGSTTPAHKAAKPKLSARDKEIRVSNRLADELHGQTEVPCWAGRIDVLTDTEVIEVKVGSRWKNALGQVLAYRVFFPRKQPRLHLFGNIDSMQKRTIEKVCSAYAVRVTYEP
jgi:hypothetical protein